MRVFPTLDESEDFCAYLTDAKRGENRNSQMPRYKDILAKWKTFYEWNLELDSALFNRNELNFTPKELVAMTLHEIGHVLYSEKPLEVFYRAFKENQLRMKLTDQATQKAMHMIYMIPLSIACMQRRWVNGKNEIHVEIIADKTVADYGYGEHLITALDKIIHQFGSSDSNDNQQYAEVNSSVQWCNKNILDVFKRKDHLKDELFYQGIKAHSNYLKAASVVILDKVGFNLREKYNGIATEATVELLNDPELLQKYDLNINVTESAKFDKSVMMYQQEAEAALEAIINKRKKVRVVLPSQYEIDAISVEVDNIQNHHDRIFVLDLIYELLERINTFEEAISPDQALVRKWQDKINMMKDELNQYRKATLEKKTFTQSSYHLFVKLPPQAADYEG